MLVSREIVSGWQLALVRTADQNDGSPDPRSFPTVPASVPGCVHTDLLRAHLIPDPRQDLNEPAVSWAGRASWRYATTLRGPSGTERVDLVFDGLDTEATISVGGKTVGSTHNMHRRYRFDVTDQLPSGTETPLEVVFESPYERALELRRRTGELPSPYAEPYQYTRKMACSFGWDWGPTVVTSGIWRPARLELWSTARIDSLHVVPVLDSPTSGTLRARVTVRRAPSGADRTLRARLTLAGRGHTWTHVEDIEGDHADITWTISGVEPWWPHGEGDQPLYSCTVQLLDECQPIHEASEILDERTQTVGFRHVHVDTHSDDEGEAYTVVINGRRLFMRGLNWIPASIFPSEVGSEAYHERLTQAVATGANLIRVWGGGTYESDAFYDTCDELGLLVFQDFAFACAGYPETEEFVDEVRQEAEDNIERLGPHPSLIVWNGNNECLWLHNHDHWEGTLKGRPWGTRYWLDLIPGLITHLDPTRSYAAGSPWSGSWQHDPNDPAYRTHHSWDVWNIRDYSAYLDDQPRFVAEFGWQAPPVWSTLRNAVTDEPLLATSPGVLHRQRAEDGQEKLARGIVQHFGEPADTECWHYLAQLVQCRAIATGIEHWRSSWPHCAGTIMWQLNDLWPAISWSAIDSEGRLKPLYHELGRLYDDHLVSLRPGTDPGGPGAAILSNFGTEPWEANLRLRIMHATEGQQALRTASVRVEPRSNLRVCTDELRIADPAQQFIVADVVDTSTGGTRRASWFADSDRALLHPPAQPRVNCRQVSGGVELDVSSDVLIRDLLVQPDRIDPDAHATRGFTTILPGETQTIGIRTARRLSVEDFGAPGVILHLADVLLRNEAEHAAQPPKA